MRAPLTGTKRKDGRWQITVTLTRPDGAKIPKTLYALTQREVQDKARVLLHGTGRTAHEPHTILDLVEVYKSQRWPDHSEGTRKQHGPAYKRIVAFFGGRELRSIDTPLITRWIRSMESEPQTTGRTVQAYRNVLSSLLNFARELGWILENPAKGIQLRKSTVPRPRNRLTPPDFQAILRAEPDAVLRDLWEFLGETGMRPNEALKMHSNAIFYSMDVWWIRGGGKTAAGTDREIPLPDSLAHRLKEREGWLFPIAKGTRPYFYRHVVDLWADACKRANVPYVNPYQLRKMAVSRWIAAGLPDDVVKSMAGHANICLTKDVYLRLGRDRLMVSLYGAHSVTSLSELMGK